MASRFTPDRDIEQMDTTPMEIPIGAGVPRSLRDIMLSYMGEAVAKANGTWNEQESWEESQDFEEEDPDMLDLSPYELIELDEEPAAVLPATSPEAAPEAPESTKSEDPHPTLASDSGERPDETG